MSGLPENLYAAAGVRELDRRTIEDFGVPGYTLMCRAGAATFEALDRRWPERPLEVICGAGNNAGDGYVIARLAREAGRRVEVIALLEPERLRGDALTAAQDYADAGGVVRTWPAGAGAGEDGPPVIVDALLGTGLDREVGGRFAEAVAAINAAPGPVVAVDIPSGMQADTGRVMGVAVSADLTVTFVGMKAGLLTGRGPALCGEILFDDLGAPAAASEGVPLRARRITSAEIRRCLPPRPADAHKGLSGHVLVIGGGPGMPGAARLAGEAALRAGAGLVSVATVPEHVAVIAAARPELMCAGVRDAADLTALFERASVIALGPGLGQSDWARAVADAALASGLPVVLDADGLNLLAAAPRSRPDWVLTPHPGEAARLLDSDTSTIQRDRFAAVARLAERYGGTAVLKGAGSLVQSGDETPWLCAAGNPGMAVAGMGDVLTGTIAAVAAQCNELGPAARCGVLIHARAGDLAAGTHGRGLLASDLLEPIRQQVNPP
ncbi:MAG: NAD(P)H-hydrate dehydratase [Gammaproteobacteria bacterium]|jgi:NAD(P)H-hydrate epimerase